MNNDDINPLNRRQDGINRCKFLKCEGANRRAKTCSSSCGKLAFRKRGNKLPKTSRRLFFLTGFLLLVAATAAFACPAKTGYAKAGQYDKAFTGQADGGNSEADPDYYQSSNNPLRGD